MLKPRRVLRFIKYLYCKKARGEHGFSKKLDTIVQKNSPPIVMIEKMW